VDLAINDVLDTFLSEPGTYGGWTCALRHVIVSL